MIKRFAAAIFILVSIFNIHSAFAQFPADTLHSSTLNGLVYSYKPTCKDTFFDYSNQSYFIQKKQVTQVLELGELIHIPAYLHNNALPGSGSVLLSAGIAIHASPSGLNNLTAKVYSADSTGGPQNLIATSDSVTMLGIGDSTDYLVTFNFIAKPVVPHWIVVSIAFPAGYNSTVYTSTPGCVQFPGYSYIKYNDGAAKEHVEPFRDVYDYVDGNGLAPAETDFGIFAFMQQQDTTGNGRGSSCSDVFILYPDSINGHVWYLHNFTNGAGQVTTTINWGDGTSSTTLDTLTHTYATPGYYNICITMTDGSGCSSTYCDSSVYISRMQQGNEMITVHMSNVNSITGINTIKATQQKMSVTPNPCSTCTIKGVDDAALLLVTDLLGRKVNASLTKTAEGYNLHFAHYQTGMFLLKNIKTGEVVKVMGE